MFIGGVIDDQIHYDPNPGLMGFRQERVKVLHRAEFIHNGIVIGDVIAVVVIGRTVDRTEPDHVDPKFCKVRDFGTDAVQVADSVPV